MNKEGQTPLNVASMCGYEHSVEYLSQFQSQQFYSGIFDKLTLYQKVSNNIACLVNWEFILVKNPVP